MKLRMHVWHTRGDDSSVSLDDSFISFANVACVAADAYLEAACFCSEPFPLSASAIAFKKRTQLLVTQRAKSLQRFKSSNRSQLFQGSSARWISYVATRRDSRYPRQWIDQVIQLLHAQQKSPPAPFIRIASHTKRQCSSNYRKRK